MLGCVPFRTGASILLPSVRSHCLLGDISMFPCIFGLRRSWISPCKVWALMARQSRPVCGCLADHILLPFSPRGVDQVCGAQYRMQVSGLHPLLVHYTALLLRPPQCHVFVAQSCVPPQYHGGRPALRLMMGAWHCWSGMQSAAWLPYSVSLLSCMHAAGGVDYSIHTSGHFVKASKPFA